MALLEIKDLLTTFSTEEGNFAAVDRLSFSLDKGLTLGLVGESGCGKSVTALSILRLIPTPPGKIAGGQVIFDNSDLLKLTEKQMRSIRGNRISMVFQEPVSSLNPVFNIGNQIAEAVSLHQGVGRREAWDRAVEMLRLVRIPEPAERAKSYPNQLSGGMCQRAMIAMALACRPDILIADEITTALDVTIQAQILELISDLQKELDMAVLVITHDLGIVAERVDRVLVMYAGVAFEEAEVGELFANPQNPYTLALFDSLPHPGGRAERLRAIEGVVPNLAELPLGCRFQDRCPEVIGICREKEPGLKNLGNDHWCRCWRRE